MSLRDYFRYGDTYSQWDGSPTGSFGSYTIPSNIRIVVVDGTWNGGRITHLILTLNDGGSVTWLGTWDGSHLYNPRKDCQMAYLAGATASGFVVNLKFGYIC